ncbi:ParB N-terminal domain-containing protein [Vibrio cholerae]
MRYETVDLDRLQLDSKNPRLPLKLRDAPDQQVVDWMLSDASLIELMMAIGANGFFPGEPLLVTEENGKLVVIEGNRRLASLMILSEKIVPTVQVGSVSQVKEKTTKRPTDIPVIWFDRRDQIEKYLGFRHVTGVKEWSPLAKARYLKSLINSVVDGFITNEQYRELAKQIGSKRPYVQRLIVSYELYELIERESFYNITDLDEDRFHFTYLMDSLNRPEIRKFIGVDFERLNVLEYLDQDNLKQLIEWFFLRLPRNGRPAMNASSGQLAMFCAILENKASLEKFKEESNLQSAYELTVDKESSYRDLIGNAEDGLREALVSITSVSSFVPSDIESLDNIQKYVAALKKLIQKS